MSPQQASTWYVLNHYNSNGISDIINSDYFISPEGRTNPDAEYAAFINILRAYMQDGSNVELLCQFPARVTFAANTLDWFSEKDRPYCKDYSSEANPTNIESVSLIFASGYFENPSSYYGHTLLKFNYGRNVLNQRTLNSSLNYGADSGNEDGTLMYVLNGLFGGYQASYQRNNNFINTHRYTNSQLRDIWEYKLNLTPEQLKFVVEHSWELMRAKFTYYFFNDNCAHRIADLIERATSSKLAYSHGFWVIPIQVVEHAKVINTSKGGLISSEIYHPSLKSTFNKRYTMLYPEEKRAFLSFFGAADHEKDKVSHGLNNKTLGLILDYLDIQLAKLTIKKSKGKDEAQMQEQRRIVLAELLQRPAGYKQDRLSWGENNTLLNYKPISVVRVGLLNRQNKNYSTFQYQMASNDLLDVPMFGQERSKVIMGNFQADVSNTGVQLRDLTFIDIMNLNTSQLPMWLTNEYSWQLRVAYDHRNNICKSCGALGVTAKAGKSIRLNDDVMGYVLAGGALRHRDIAGFSPVSLVGDSAIVYSRDADTAFKIGVNVIYDPLNDKSDSITSSEFSYKWSEDKDIRFSYERSSHNGDLLSIKLGYYFN